MLMLGVETSLLDWYEVSIALQWDREWEDLTERWMEVLEDKTLRIEKIKVFDSNPYGVLDLWGEIKKKKIIKEEYTCVAGSGIVDWS